MTVMLSLNFGFTGWQCSLDELEDRLSGYAGCICWLSMKDMMLFMLAMLSMLAGLPGYDGYCGWLFWLC
jgi:hypothetical protein